MQHIRNFSIIAHIDHGKSTLADRLIQRCGGLSDREMEAQVLDSMDLERERGITIKAQTAALEYVAADGTRYSLNLIDTPGHVDFSYEVSRSLSACEGALLVVDASQGVEAQTVANCYTAIELGVEVLPILNKMDLPSANAEEARAEIEDVIGIDAHDAVLASAKTGMGLEEILERIIERVPPPKGDPASPLQALIIDSWFDNYVGVVMLVRVVNGVLKPKDKILLMASGATHLVEQVGVFTPKSRSREQLSAGDVGFVISGIKDAEVAQPGSAVGRRCRFRDLRHQGAARRARRRHRHPHLPAGGAAAARIQGSEVAGFRRTLPGRIQPVRSAARCAHQAAAERRLAALRARGVAGARIRLPLRLPWPAAHGHRAGAARARVRHGPHHHGAVGEPIVDVTIFVPQEYVGQVITLCIGKRGVQTDLTYHSRHVILKYELPLAEIVLDFFDKLKSVSRGYASMDYEFKEYRAADVVKVDMLINGDRVDALSVIVHRANAMYRGREVTAKMRKLIPRQMYDVAIQASIGANIIAREDVKALRKNVLAKCYGGDITRKKKLLEKQKAGKKRMKQVGTVEIPQEAFLAILQVEDK